MKKIYIDFDYKCHVENDGSMDIVETDFFDGKCNGFIEGYRYIPTNNNWTRDDGLVFTGEMVSPWRPYVELDSIQREYEKQLLSEYENTIAELDAALLDAHYINLVEGL